MKNRIYMENLKTLSSVLCEKILTFTYWNLKIRYQTIHASNIERYKLIKLTSFENEKLFKSMNGLW